jgi:branched-chain amino acid aminotransferase
MSSKVWIDGNLLDKTDAKVSVFDHGLLFGDGVWEGMRIYGGRVFKLREHLDHLRASAGAIGLSLPLSSDELASAVEATVRANDRTEGYVRLTATRGVGTLGLDPRKCDPSVIVVAEDVVPYPRELADHGLNVIAVEWPRPEVFATHLSRAGLVQVKSFALEAGCLEALLFDPDGRLMGATEAAALVVSAGVVTTPPDDETLSDPVFRRAVLELADRAGIPTAEATLHRGDVWEAEEVFLAGAAGELVAVVKVGDHPIGDGRPGPVTGRLREFFHETVRRPVG